MAKYLKVESEPERIRKFARNHWEKSACVIPAPSSLAEVSADDIFHLLVRYCDQARDEDSMVGLKFYASGVLLEPFQALEHLPESQDQNFLGYHKRVSRQFKDYGLVCDELYSVMVDERAKTRRSIWKFTDNLFKNVGLPNRFAEIGLYLGNYRKTPFGVHVDNCGVLSLPIVGKKNFRIWSAKFVAKNSELKESFSYDEFKKDSVLLTVRPGEMAYWPSADWHIAESDGSFSATWSLGVWTDKPTERVAIEAVSQLLQQKLKKGLKQGRAKTALKYSKKLPDELERAAEALSKLSKKEIKRALEAWWHDHIDAKGFKSPTARKPN